MHKLWILFMGLGLFAQQIDINTGTKGTLNVNRGGTGAATAGAALANLGGISASSTDTLTNKTLTNPKINAVLDPSNGSVVLQILSTTGATEGFSMTPSTSGNAPILNSFGSGSNVDMTLDPKGTGILRLPIADEVLFGDGSTDQVLAKAANGRSKWVTLGSGGTVTSVGLTGIGSFLSVSGSPVTTSGSFGLTLDTQTQNLIFASPNGSTGVPSFRAMVAGDVPSLDASKITSGLLDTARVVSGTITNSRCLHVDISGNITVTSSDCGTGSGGITSVNSQVGPGITITSGVTGSDFGVAALSNTITINCPTASATNRGCLSTADWSTFSGKVSGPGMATSVNNFAVWADTSGLILGTGFAGSTTATANSVAMRDANGDLYANWFRGSAVSVDLGQFRSNGLAAIRARRSNDAFVGDNIVEYRRFDDTSILSAIDWNGHFTGRSATTLAFASNPANCVTAGQAAAGINASGEAEGCFTPAGSNGLGIYNVKDATYGAIGDGSNDDTAEVQAAIDACQNSSRGGIVYFPPGIYAISAALTMGNGSGGTESTKTPCTLEGAGGTGAGTASVRLGASIIRWTGAAPGSVDYMLKFQGPFIGGGVKHLTLDANSKSNLRGHLISTVSHMYSEGQAIINYASLGMLITATTLGSHGLYGACDNYFSHLKIVWPATGGSGLSLEGNDTSGGMDACSNNFYGGMIWHDNGTAGTYGVNLGFADNNRFWSVNIYGFPETSTNGSAIKFTQQATNTAFPHENTFYSVSAHQGVTGTVGAGQPNIFYDWHLGDCWHNCDPYSVSGSVKPIVFSTDRTMKGVYSGGSLYTSTNEDFETFTIEHSSGGQNGAGNIFFKRTGTNIGRIKAHYFDGLGLYVGDGGGTGTLYERLRLRTNGIITPSSVTFSTLGGEPTGSLGYCSDCQVTSSADNTCASGGSGAVAWKVNGTWRCFASQN